MPASRTPQERLHRTAPAAAAAVLVRAGLFRGPRTAGSSARSLSARSLLSAVVAAVVLAVSACGGSEPAPEPEASPRGLPEAAAAQPQGADGPDIEDTPDPELDTTAVAAVDEAAGLATTAAAASTTDDGRDGADGTASSTVCDAGEVLLEQYVSGSDDGCRPEACELGRDYQGECLGEHVALIAGPTTTLAAQPAGDPCEQPAAGDPLRFSSDSFDPDNLPPVYLERGMWRLDICVRHNDRATGRPERLTVTLATPVVEGQPMRFRMPLDVISVANGDWSSDEFAIRYPDPIPPLLLDVDTVGGGDWVVTFTQIAAEAAP